MSRGVLVACAVGLAGCSAVLGLDEYKEDGASGSGGSAASGSTTSSGSMTTGSMTTGSMTTSSGTGGAGPACKDGKREVGEVCFGDPPLDLDLGPNGANDVLLGDCDGDGDQDIITATHDYLYSYRNDGGAFDNRIESPWGGCTPAYLGKWEHAGTTFFRAATCSGRLLEMAPDAAGGCSFTFPKQTSASAFAAAVTIDDFDLNGQPDGAWVGGKVNTDSLFMGLNGSMVSTWFYGDVMTPTDIVAGDFRGDSQLDLAITDVAQNRISIVENLGGGMFDAVGNIPNLGSGPVAIATGDLDKDGSQDLVTANRDSATVAVLKRSGLTSFAAQIPEPSVKGTNTIDAKSPNAIAVGDIDGDGFVDAVTANNDDPTGATAGSVSIFINNGMGKLLLGTKANFPAIETESPTRIGKVPVAIALADLNGDGALDIVVTSSFVDSQNHAYTSVLLSTP